ncbi:MAG TPA: CxxC-x17-CxxC domain-containing protein [Candidatus Paceibacterota bacterium]
MGKFNKGFGDRGNRGGFGGGDRGNRGGSDGGRDFGRPTLFDATCGDCGKETKVPFRPTGERPVFCRDCFAKHGGGQERGRQAGARNGFEKFRKPDRPDNFAPRQQTRSQSQGMQSVGVSSTGNERNNNNELKAQIEQMNSKLERLIASVEKLVAPKLTEVKTLVAPKKVNKKSTKKTKKVL